MSTKRLYIKTYGCQMNVHDSERISGLLRDEGYRLTGRPEEASMIIVNTCSIREKSEHKAYSSWEGSSEASRYSGRPPRFHPENQP